jgi:hypothetical protein
MAVFTSTYTGAQIDAGIGKIYEGYGGIDYTIATSSDNGNTKDSITIDGRVALTVISLTGNVSSLSIASGKNPKKQHSAHVILANNSVSDTYTVTISHNANTSICPDGTDPDPLEVPAGGYVEIDFLCINTTDNTSNDKIYVRGI